MPFTTTIRTSTILRALEHRRTDAQTGLVRIRVLSGKDGASHLTVATTLAVTRAHYCRDESEDLLCSEGNPAVHRKRKFVRPKGGGVTRTIGVYAVGEVCVRRPIGGRSLKIRRRSSPGRQGEVRIARVHTGGTIKSFQGEREEVPVTVSPCRCVSLMILPGWLSGILNLSRPRRSAMFVFNGRIEPEEPLALRDSGALENIPVSS